MSTLPHGNGGGLIPIALIAGDAWARATADGAIAHRHVARRRIGNVAERV